MRDRSGSMDRDTARTGGRRDQILDAAGSLFAARGYERTPIREIARTCGITEAAIYRHFESKAQLYEEVIRHKADRRDIAGRLQEFAGCDAVEELLEAVARFILDLAASDPELLRLMSSSTFEGGDLATVLFCEIRLPIINFVAGELERLRAAGTILDIDPYITSRCFVGMVMDCALNIGVWELVTEAEFRADDVICNNVPIFARGLEGTAAG